MKKILFFVTLLLCANLMFGQSISMGIHDGVDNDAQIDVSALVPGDKVYISLSVDAIDPGQVIWGMGLFFNVPAGYLSWDGTGAVPMPGVTYVNPLFPPVILPANVAVNWYLHPNGITNVFGYLQGDGGSFVDLTGQAFPVTILTLKFTYLGGVAPGMTIPIDYSVEFKTAGDFMVGGVTEVYYNDFFEVFPTTNLANASLYGGPGGCTPGLWVGTAGGGDGVNWFDPLNWDCDVVPVDEDVVIPSTGKAMVTISGGVASTAALSVAPGAGIIIASNGGLTTNGLYTNDGSLLIQSDAGAGYAGTFIDNGGLAGAGTFEFDRNVICSGTQAGTGNPFGWHYLAAPFDGLTTDDIPDYFVNAWDQAAGMWMQYSNPVPPNCTPWPTTPLNVFDAWSVNRDVMYPYPACPLSAPATGMQVEFMSGVAGVHTGAYGKPLGFGGGLYQNWNMVSNPYPSGLDVNTIAFGPNTVAATYYYDGCNGNYVYWATGLGSYVMAPTLGFMVETTGADVFAVNNASRAHGADWFWKSEVSNLLTLQASGNDRTDVLNVRFANDVTPGFDNNGDAHKLFSETEGIPQIYTVAGDQMLAINALPETSTVPMGFVANGAGTYTIEAIETSEFENVVLEDLFTGVQTDLLAGSYTFEYNVGDNANRFVIHFSPLGTPELNANSINIWAANQTIYVQAPATTGDIVVYNMMGQVVVRTSIVPGLNEIPMNDANTYYIVKVLGSDVTETGKVFIK